LMFDWTWNPDGCRVAADGGGVSVVSGDAGTTGPAAPADALPPGDGATEAPADALAPATVTAGGSDGATAVDAGGLAEASAE
jgi:hypothetical protein